MKKTLIILIVMLAVCGNLYAMEVLNIERSTYNVPDEILTTFDIQELITVKKDLAKIDFSTLPKESVEIAVSAGGTK